MAITDFPPAVRDNKRSDLGEEAARPSHMLSRPKTHFGKLFDNKSGKIATKSFVLKDSTCKPFRIKDQDGNFLLTP